jgi:hypothetical protein
VAWDGWLQYGGVELANRARLRAYAEHLAPGIIRDCECACERLGDALGDGPYQSPALDGAPWFDAEEPVSAEFLGFMPLDVRGLDKDTSATATVALAGNGSAISGSRRSQKEVYVTGNLVALSEAGLDYGQQWLNTVLEGSCTSPHGEGDNLCWFAYCPEISDVGPRRTVDLDLYALRTSSPSSSYIDRTFSTVTDSGDFLTVHRARRPLPCSPTMFEVEVSSNLPTIVRLVVASDKGTSYRDYNVTSEPTKIGVIEGALADDWLELRVFSISSTSNDFVATWTPVEDGDPLEHALFTEQDPGDQLEHALMDVGQVPVEITLHSASLTYHEEVDPKTCADPAQRSLRNVFTLQASEPMREFTTSRGVFRTVNFLLAAMTPRTYGIEVPIAGSYGGKIIGEYPGASTFRSAITLGDCPIDDHRRHHMPAVIDPACPPIPAPPRAVSSEEKCYGSNIPEPVKTTVILIPSTAIPLWKDVVPRLTFKTWARPIRGTRVRFVKTPMQVRSVDDLDPCAACGEFIVDYAPPNSTFVIDGSLEKAWVEGESGMKSPATNLLSGKKGRLYDWPVLTCGGGYAVIVDVRDSDIVEVSLSLFGRGA